VVIYLDRESLVVILEDMCDDMIKEGKGVIIVEGPIIKNIGENNYECNIEFFADLPLEETEGKPIKLIGLHYKFDLNKMSDDDVFSAIAMSLLEARETTARLFFQTMFKGMAESAGKASDKQKEYLS